MSKIRHVHEVKVNLVEIWEKVHAENLGWNPITDDTFDEMLEGLQYMGPGIHKFKWRLHDETGVNNKVIYSKELGFHHLETTGEVWVFLPKSFVQGVLEAMDIKEVEREFPGLMQHLQNLPDEKEHAARVAQNRTGNHYRNKWLRIPVQPGQPVRG